MFQGLERLRKSHALTCVKVSWPASSAPDVNHMDTGKQPYTAASQLPSCPVFLCLWAQPEVSQPRSPVGADVPCQPGLWGRLHQRSSLGATGETGASRARQRIPLPLLSHQSLWKDTLAVVTVSSSGQRVGDLEAIGPHTFPPTLLLSHGEWQSLSPCRHPLLYSPLVFRNHKDGAWRHIFVLLLPLQTLPSLLPQPQPYPFYFRDLCEPPEDLLKGSRQN